MASCRKCAHALNPDAVMCPMCGTHVKGPAPAPRPTIAASRPPEPAGHSRFCLSCGSPLHGGGACPACGKHPGASAPPPTPVAAAARSLRAARKGRVLPLVLVAAGLNVIVGIVMAVIVGTSTDEPSDAPGVAHPPAVVRREGMGNPRDEALLAKVREAEARMAEARRAVDRAMVPAMVDPADDDEEPPRAATASGRARPSGAATAQASGSGVEAGTAPAPERPTAPAGAASPASEPIRNVILRRVATVRACYEAVLKKDPAIQGRVVVRWTIDTSGAVESASVASDSTGSTELGDCIVGRVRTWRFPAPTDGPVTVSYPFAFHPR